MSTTRSILEQLRNGELTLDAAEAALGESLVAALAHSTIDLDRQRRTGAAEVIYGQHKTPEQVRDIFRALAEAGQNVLATRIGPEHYAAVETVLPAARYHPDARLIELKQQAGEQNAHAIAVVSAGTSDHPVAEEAALTAEFYDNRVLRVRDVGVAGLHRLLAQVPALREARVLIVVAGMEGALPSVVGGLVDKPVIAVPTSVGYGAAFDGVAALLGMLTSCASGVSVVNIDNGFGAGFLANMINRL